jgi:hypothetical protein
MALRKLTAFAMLGFAFALPATGPHAQEADPLRGDAGEGVAACVRGRVITRHEVEKEAKMLQEAAPEVPRSTVLWYARSRLAERIILVETAKRFTAHIPDDAIEREFLSRGMELEDVIADFEELKQDFLIDIYMLARLGEIDFLDGVVPDMASFVQVTPSEIISYYKNNPGEYTTRSRVVVLRVLFPATSFPDPALRQTSAEECASLMRDPPSPLLGEDEDLKLLREKWPGCLPKKEEILGGEDRKFQKPVMEFIERAEAGAVSPVIELDGGLVVVAVIAKTAGRTLPFDEVQDRVARDLKRIKEQNARRIIIEDLKNKEKVYEPEDLFDPSRKSETDSGRNAP